MTCITMWIARDKDGSLHFGNAKPTRGLEKWIWPCASYKIDKDTPIFKDITWLRSAEPVVLSKASKGCLRKKKVVAIVNNNVILYESISCASRETGISISEISKMCNGYKYSFCRKGIKIKFKFHE